MMLQEESWSGFHAEVSSVGTSCAGGVKGEALAAGWILVGGWG